jgi:hypothetical protein
MSASDRREVLLRLAKLRRKRAHTAEMLRVLVQCAGLRAGVQSHATRLWRRRCCWRGVTLASAGCTWCFSLPSGMCSAPWAEAAALAMMITTVIVARKKNLVKRTAWRVGVVESARHQRQWQERCDHDAIDATAMTRDIGIFGKKIAGL